MVKKIKQINKKQVKEFTLWLLIIPRPLWVYLLFVVGYFRVYGH